jgi:hypothetical protein
MPDGVGLLQDTVSPMGNMVHFFKNSNFFDLSVTEEILVVEMRIWYVKIGIVLVLYISQQEKCMFVL